MIHLLNQQLTVTWVLRPNPIPPVEADLDIYQTNPDNEASYTDTATFLTFTAPTTTAPGSVTYQFTPDILGRWEITLAIGTLTTHVVQAFRQFYIVNIIADGVTPFVTHTSIRGRGL